MAHLTPFGAGPHFHSHRHSFWRWRYFLLVWEVVSVVEFRKPPASNGLAMILRTTSLAFLILSFLIVLLTDGGVYPQSLAVAVMCMAVAIIVGGLKDGIHKDTSRLFTLVLSIWAIVIVWTVLQAITLPFDLMANPAWRSLQDADISAPGRISVAPGDTIAMLLPISLPFMTILASLLVFRSDRQVELALKIVGIAGGVLAIFAITQAVFFPKTLMFAAKQDYIGDLTAPFVNRNTAATFYGLIVLVLLACAGLTASESGQSRRGPSSLRLLERPQLYVLLTMIALVAVALTKSRAGGFATLVGVTILLVGLAVHFTTQKTSLAARVAGVTASRVRRLAAIGIAGAGFATVILSVFSRTIFRAELTAEQGGRVCVTPGIVAAVRDNIVSGIGSGSFRYYFPAYRDPNCGLSSAWFRAHNFFLDTALALGLFIPLLLLLASAVAFWWVYKTGLRRRKSKKPVVWAGIAAVALVIIHSIPDFSVQIPGFSMMFSLFFGLSSTISLNSTRRKVQSNR